MDGIGEGAYHPEIHTGEYYDEVERRLQTATLEKAAGREKCLKAFQKI